VIGGRPEVEIKQLFDHQGERQRSQLPKSFLHKEIICQKRHA
jgi:hypothetical protein